MAFQQRLRPYETLIRHNENGTIGSHHIRIQELFDDVSGVVLYAQVQPPQQLDGAGLEAVIGTAFVQATAQIAATQQALSSANVTLNDQAAQLASQSATLLQRDATIADLASQVAALQALIDAYTQSAAAAEPAPEPEAAAAAPEA